MMKKIGEVIVNRYKIVWGMSLIWCLNVLYEIWCFFLMILFKFVLLSVMIDVVVLVIDVVVFF